MDKSLSINVVIALGHQLLAEVVQSVLSTPEDITVSATVTTPDIVLETILRYEPDVLLLDMQFIRTKGSLSLTVLKQAARHTEILIYSEYAEPSTAIELLHSGAYAYLLKDSSAQTLLNAVRCSKYRKPVLDRRLMLKLGAEMTLLNGIIPPKALQAV